MVVLLMVDQWVVIGKFLGRSVGGCVVDGLVDLGLGGGCVVWGLG